MKNNNVNSISLLKLAYKLTATQKFLGDLLEFVTEHMNQPTSGTRKNLRELLGKVELAIILQKHHIASSKLPPSDYFLTTETIFTKVYRSSQKLTEEEEEEDEGENVVWTIKSLQKLLGDICDTCHAIKNEGDQTSFFGCGSADEVYPMICKLLNTYHQKKTAELLKNLDLANGEIERLKTLLATEGEETEANMEDSSSEGISLLRKAAEKTALENQELKIENEEAKKIKEENGKLLNTIRGKDDSIQKLEEERDALKEKLKTQEETYDNRLEEKGEKITAKATEIGGLNRHVTALSLAHSTAIKEKDEELRNQRNELEEQLQGKDNTIGEIEKQLTAEREKGSRLQQERDALASKANELENQQEAISRITQKGMIQKVKRVRTSQALFNAQKGTGKQEEIHNAEMATSLVWGEKRTKCLRRTLRFLTKEYVEIDFYALGSKLVIANQITTKKTGDNTIKTFLTHNKGKLNETIIKLLKPLEVLPPLQMPVTPKKIRNYYKAVLLLKIEKDLPIDQENIREILKIDPNSSQVNVSALLQP